MIPKLHTPRSLLCDRECRKQCTGKLHIFTKNFAAIAVTLSLSLSPAPTTHNTETAVHARYIYRLAEHRHKTTLLVQK